MNSSALSLKYDFNHILYQNSRIEYYEIFKKKLKKIIEETQINNKINSESFKCENKLRKNATNSVLFKFDVRYFMKFDNGNLVCKD